MAWKEVQTSEVSTARNLEEQKKSDVRKLEENFFFSRSNFFFSRSGAKENGEVGKGEGERGKGH